MSLYRISFKFIIQIIQTKFCHFLFSKMVLKKTILKNQTNIHTTYNFKLIFKFNNFISKIILS